MMRHLTQRGTFTLTTVMLLTLGASTLFVTGMRLQRLDLWQLDAQIKSQTALQTANSGNLETLGAIRDHGAYLLPPLCNNIGSWLPANRYCSDLYPRQIDTLHSIQVSTVSLTDSDAHISRTLVILPWLQHPAPTAALIFPGNLVANIELHLRGNPNGGGPGIATAVWSSGRVQLSTNASGLVLADGQLLNDSIPLEPSVVDQALPQAQGGDFPDDLFEYLFGIPASRYPVIAETAIHLAAEHCQQLDQNSSGLFWIEGHGSCELGNVGQAASNSNGNAVILILNGVGLKLNHNAKIYGIVVAFATDAASASLQTLHFEPGSQIWGSLISTQELEQRLSGSLTLIWQDWSRYFAQPQTSPLGAILLLPGSWMNQ